MEDWREQCKYIGPFYEGRAAVCKAGKEGHIDKQGRVTTPIIYDAVWSFYEGRAKVRKGDKWGYVDLNGKEIKEE